MLFTLITDNQIHGRIRHEKGEIYLETIPVQD